jgi:hypothetical protein
VQILQFVPHPFCELIIRWLQVSGAIDYLTNLITEKNLSIGALLASKSAFVYQPVMISAELYEIPEARLAAIGPNPPAVINIGSMIGAD